MTVEEAIKILKFERGYFCDFKGCQEQQAYAMAIKALEQTRWIPVSERLPEEGQRVLVTDKLEAVTTAMYFTKSPFWREMAVAWMPLPQPYKVESDDNKCCECEYNEDILTASEHYSQCNCPEYNTTFPEFKGNCPHFKVIKERRINSEKSI